MVGDRPKAGGSTSAKDQEWITRWIKAIADGKAKMSQRRMSSIATHGGLEAVITAAKAQGVHLVQLTDDKGVVLVAASRAPFTALC